MNVGWTITMFKVNRTTESRLVSQITNLVQQSEDRIMEAVDVLNTALAALKAEDVIIIDALAGLNQKVADLTAALAAAQNVDPAVAAAAQAINDEVAKLAAAVAPPAPTPAPAEPVV